jgi:hypothetical protein
VRRRGRLFGDAADRGRRSVADAFTNADADANSNSSANSNSGAFPNAKPHSRTDSVAFSYADPDSKEREARHCL